MKNKKLFGIVGGTTLSLVLVAILGISYATYSETLEITGSGTVHPAKWDIGFSDQQVQITKESATSGYETDITEGTANADGTSLSISNAALKRPGDSITYTFEVENKGDFDAILQTANITLTCNDKQEECSKLIKVSLLDNTDSVLAESDASTKYNNGDTSHKLIHSSSTKETFKLKIEYKKDTSTEATGLATEDITIDEFGATLTYEQSEA